MNLLNELLSLSESNKGTTLVGYSINGELITDKTKDEVWTGDFFCDGLQTRNTKLESLEGSPKKVIGNFDCTDNPNLISLKGSPKEVTGYFYCSRNDKLTSLEGAPEEISGNFHCADNKNLISLKGAPKKGVEDFYCDDNPKITSLKGIHKQVTYIGGRFLANRTPIKSHILGLLLIKGCTGVEIVNKDVQDILNKYLPNTRGNKAVIECQSELLDADLDDFAEL